MWLSLRRVSLGFEMGTKEREERKAKELFKVFGRVCEEWEGSHKTLDEA
jgi:hypothetical protein